MAMSFVSTPALRRLLWRTGRYLYCRARGETVNDMDANGETYVQSRVIGQFNKDGEPNNVFDIGANEGEWTRRLIAQAPPDALQSTTVWLFEPLPRTYERLTKNLEGIAGKGRLRTVNCAMSDEEGTTQMAVLSETGGSNTIHFDQKLRSQAQAITSIQTKTLDGFCREHSIWRINMLKCDTEGHDLRVLRGALPLFSDGRIDVAQFEYNSRWIYSRSYLKDVFDMFSGLPYRIARIRPGHIELFEDWHFELERFFEANYLVVSDNALDWFDVRRGSFDASNTYA